ncbi:tRNA pseudouridine synthase-like 1 [Hylaeus anthracinus]|uniref:tRNA pseudouridine synthase-like 1 n=1 Tax=Hylaeus anthracinus TaxID=313031 RepID=UPI0023B9A029|nr:tRNA pseudouridine synthase-like 1 [Hylaeus anthracinus]
MVRYFFRFSYLGTQYRGLQKNVFRTDRNLQDPDTIQGALECAFASLLPKYTFWPKITLSSRTDSGVHALCSAAHIDLENKNNVIYMSDDVLRFVNRYLLNCNHDIRLLDFTPVTSNFHARRFAKSRTYIYRLVVAKDYNDHRIPITEKLYSCTIRSEDFDIERLKHGMQLFIGKKDFQTFSARKHTDRPINYVRVIDKLTIEKGQPFMPLDPFSQNFEYWNIIFRSKGFLYRQVRRIVGSLISLGLGVITEKDIVTMLQVPGHHNWPSHLQSAPPYGLFLANVEYCQEDIETHTIKVEEKSVDSKIVVSAI